MKIFDKQLSIMGTQVMGITCKGCVKPSIQKGIWFIQTCKIFLSNSKWPMPLTTEVFQSYKPFSDITDILCE